MPSWSSPSNADRARTIIMVGVMFRSRPSERQGERGSRGGWPAVAKFVPRCPTGKTASTDCAVARSMVTKDAARKGEFQQPFQRDLGRPDWREKIFRFRHRANQLHNSARLTADEERQPSSRTRGEMRWTRKP